MAALKHSTVRKAIRNILIVLFVLFAGISAGVGYAFGKDGKLQNGLIGGFVTFAGLWMVVVIWFGGPAGVNAAFGDGSIRRGSKRKLLLSKEGVEKLRVVAISDTHELHRSIKLPAGDVLIHAGDFTMAGDFGKMRNFISWLREQQPKFKHGIIVCPGNHDMSLDFGGKKFKRWKDVEEEARAILDELKSVCTVLVDESVTVEGVTFHGSPWSPYFSEKTRMGFQESSANLKPYWQMIPEGVDVLMVHTPPKGFGDRILVGKRVGCPELLKQVQALKPQFCVSGHIHEAYGVYKDSHTTYINASSCNLLYYAKHKPIVFDVAMKNKNSLSTSFKED